MSQPMAGVVEPTSAVWLEAFPAPSPSATKHSASPEATPNRRQSSAIHANTHVIALPQNTRRQSTGLVHVIFRLRSITEHRRICFLNFGSFNENSQSSMPQIDLLHFSQSRIGNSADERGRGS